MTITKETYTFLDEDIARFLEDSQARRRTGPANDGSPMAGPYERAMRVLGRYIDDQKPKDVFFFEQDGSYVLRLLMSTRQGSKHQLAEFTATDLAFHGRARVPVCAARMMPKPSPPRWRPADAGPAERNGTTHTHARRSCPGALARCGRACHRQRVTRTLIGHGPA